MTVYAVLLLLLCVCGFGMRADQSAKNRKIFLFLTFTVLGLFLGLRGASVGEDTQHYIDIFRYSADVSWSSIFHSRNMRTGYFTDANGYTDTIENGYLILCKLVRLFTSNAHIFLCIVALATCWLFARFIYDNTEQVFYAAYIFVCDSMFMMSFNLVRQMLAVAIAVQAYAAMKQRQWKRALLIILLAAFIHNVALVCLILIPIMRIREGRERRAFRYILLLTVLMPVVVYLLRAGIILLFPRYRLYFTTNYWNNSLGGTALLVMLELVLVGLLYLKNRFHIEESFQLSAAVLLFLACEIAGLKITMFSRVGLFFRAYLILFFPKVERVFVSRDRPWCRGLIMLLLGLLYLSYARSPARMYIFL